ncbi:MAG TPA: TetR/AcrR family transcriptional regulator, partial [Bacilli bacterium]|nr:TetR/AcrR family transcriptional regulator [Bacilli bacterium]
KKKRLLASAYDLFTTKGINSTTIQDIVDAAKVAKGTFYLYFADKYNIQEQLIISKSEELFNNAMDELSKHKIEKFDNQIIFVVDYVIDELIKAPELLNFISKDLSMGIYSEKLNQILGSDHIKLYDMFIKGVKDNNIKLNNPEVTLYMIIEFTSSTLFSVFNRRIGLTIDEYKPYLHRVIKSMLSNGY